MQSSWCVVSLTVGIAIVRSHPKEEESSLEEYTLEDGADSHHFQPNLNVVAGLTSSLTFFDRHQCFHNRFVAVLLIAELTEVSGEEDMAAPIRAKQRHFCKSCYTVSIYLPT